MKYEPLIANNYYHIFNQGNNKEDIFIEEMNYTYFLELLNKYIYPIATILSYCLLKNHFHLLVQIKNIPEENQASKAFSNFFNSYAKSINKKYNRTGSLFRDRFKRIKIAEEGYLKKLIVYINLNPIHHGFTSNLNEYKHSSFLALMSNKTTLLQRDEVIQLFDDKENFKYYLESKKLELDEKLKLLTLE